MFPELLSGIVFRFPQKSPLRSLHSMFPVVVSGIFRFSKYLYHSVLTLYAVNDLICSRFKLNLKELQETRGNSSL